MSVTIVAAPVLLYKASVTIAAIFAASAATCVKIKNINSEIDNIQIENIDSVVHISNDVISQMQEKEFETPFVDRNTLVKTLEEYGGEIKKEMLGYIKYVIEDFIFEFYKENQDAECPYKLKITYRKADSLDNILEDIQSEYTSNTQEASYNKIIKRLEDKNLQYEEEVCEDDSIVITVNLD